VRRFSCKPFIEVNEDGTEVSLIIYLEPHKRLRFPLKDGIIENSTNEVDNNYLMVYKEDNLSTIELRAKENGLI
jgi:hypothetical protein